jgi:Zn-dependent oligopeptidase
MKEEQLKPYFSLENVLKELFRLSNDVFGITIKQQACVETWHEPFISSYEYLGKS